jgi:hypothetical protein
LQLKNKSAIIKTMEEAKNRYFFIIASLFFLFTFLLILTSMIQKIKKNSNQITPPPSPTFPPPTSSFYQNKTRTTPWPTFFIPTTTQTITPNLTPKEFTGVKEEPIPQEMVDFSKQKLSLMEKLPLKTTDFSIDFDYDKAKFVVSLNSPKEESQKKFEDWLKNSFPSIPKDLFLFQ